VELSSTRVRVCLSLQDQLVVKWMHRAHTDSVFDDHLRMERKFHKLTSGFGLSSKFHQNLPRCCVVSFWFIYAVLGRLWGIVPQTLHIESSEPMLGFGFCFGLIYL
jgi:hypothetical protein